MFCTLYDICYDGFVSRIVAIFAALVAFACAKAGQESDVKRTPNAPPSPTSGISKELTIPLEIDGVKATAITAGVLGGVKPDYSDKTRRAWRLETIVAAFRRTNAVAEVVSANGTAILMRPPKQPTDPLPVLSLTRRGDIVAALVSPRDPFPQYHGRGGRLQRPGDPRPRATSIELLRIYIEQPSAADQWRANEVAGKQAIGALEVRIDEEPQVGIEDKVMERLRTLSILGDDGEKRPAWSLRNLAQIIVGPKGPLVRVHSNDNQVATIAKADWDNTDKTPVLRVNRRGILKFQWIGENGTPTGDRQIRAVTRIDLSRGGASSDSSVTPSQKANPKKTP